MLKRNCNLVLVADGRRALCLVPQKNGWQHLHTLWSLERNIALDHEGGLDRPGRFQGRAGLPRSAYEAPSHHDAAIVRFLQEVAHRVEETLKREGSDRLAIVASPSTLGILRSVLPAYVSHRVVQELVRDYTRASKAELEKKLLGTHESP